jgi:periplasmic protein CpxP/Spy
LQRVNEEASSFVSSFVKETETMKRIAIRQLAPVAALLFALGGTLASAQDDHGRHGKMGGGGFGMMHGLSRLDLTDSQKAEVKRIMDARKATFDSLHERARADWEALDAAADARSPNPATVGAAYLKVRANREAMKAERQALMDQIRAILTPEQRDKLDAMKQERMRRFEERRGERDGDGR